MEQDKTCDKYGEKTTVQKLIFQRYFPTGKNKTSKGPAEADLRK